MKKVLVALIAVAVFGGAASCSKAPTDTAPKPTAEQAVAAAEDGRFRARLEQAVSIEGVFKLYKEADGFGQKRSASEKLSTLIIPELNMARTKEDLTGLEKYVAPGTEAMLVLQQRKMALK